MKDLEAARLAATLGSSRPTEPSLEDVFVSLARNYAAPAQKVAS